MKQARALRVPEVYVLYLRACTICSIASLLSLWCLRLLVFVLRWRGNQNVSSSTGHSEMNRSFYTGNSLSVLHSSQHVHEDSVPTSVHSPPTTQQLIDNMPSRAATGPQLLHRNTGSPALAGPTRYVTGETMPTSFDVALTQLSFLEFVQRCNVLAIPSRSTRRCCCTDRLTM